MSSLCQLGRLAIMAGLSLCSLGCGATVDPLGHERGEPPLPLAPDSDTLVPLTGPAVYPDLFGELLGKSEAESQALLSSAFDRLFYGNPSSEAIYFTIGDDQAYIQDILHGDVRSEGIGLGMLIAVQLDRREELDRLWRFARASLEYTAGPARGYFRSTCSDGPCIDPYGHQELIMALLFAHGRWGSRSGAIDYGSEALRLMAAMWQTPGERGAEGDTVPALIDAQTRLVVDEPSAERASLTRPSNLKPGYYALWARASGDSRWLEVTVAARSLLKSAVHPQTGLLPLRTDFEGAPVPGSDNFVPEGYRAQLNMAIDHVFVNEEPWYAEESERLLGFFTEQGIDSYGSSYRLDGSRCLVCTPSAALIAMNGVTALPATGDGRTAFVEAAWDAEPPDGQARYYDGMLHLLALLVLSGNFRIY